MNNEYDPRVGSIPFLWCLLFGPFYFMIKGVWKHVFLGILLGMLTMGLSWLIYPFFARKIVYNDMVAKGVFNNNNNIPSNIIVNNNS